MACQSFSATASAMMVEALSVMQAWGFDYKSEIIWKKDRVGTGYWGRNQHEVLMIGTRGKLSTSVKVSAKL